MEMGKGEERQIKHQVVWETEENDQGEARSGEACESGKAQGLVGMDFVAGAQKCYITSSQMIQPRKRPLT